MKNFVIWKCCLKDMNKLQQECARGEEVWRENVLWSFIVQHKDFLFGIVFGYGNLHNHT